MLTFQLPMRLFRKSNTTHWMIVWGMIHGIDCCQDEGNMRRVAVDYALPDALIKFFEVQRILSMHQEAGKLFSSQ